MSISTGAIDFTGPIDLTASYTLARAVLSKITHYRLLNNYPKHLEDVITKIRNAISKDLYEYMTSLYLENGRELYSIFKREGIVFISNNENIVLSLPNNTKFVIKSSRRSLYFELRQFLNSRPFGQDYTSSNSEGGISPCFFHLAERVAFSNRLRHVIKKHNLTMIKVPKKYLISYRNELIPFGSLPLHSKRVFVISKHCEIDYNAPMNFNDEEQDEFARQLSLFFEKARGVIDTHKGNFCFKEKKIIFFDTEKFHLDPFCRFCISNHLKESRIGLENMRRYFHELPDEKGRKLADLCAKSIENIRGKEKVFLINRLAISTITFSIAVLMINLLLFKFSIGISR